MEPGVDRLSPSELGELLVRALRMGGLAVDLESGLGERPILLSAAGLPLRVFLWNATPGGPAGVRAEDEFRVQTTRPGGVPFLQEGGRQTLLLGYHRALEIFAAWDVRRHPNPSTSSSLQIPLDALQEAADHGFASRRRELKAGEEEVVMAFAPDGTATYLDVLPSFRTAVVESFDARLGETIASGEEPEEEELPSEGERRTAAHRVVRAVRDQRFRIRVVRAYAGRCAFCGLGMGLTDAAHIWAVRDGGPDRLDNGICACPTHHRAFDRGLVIIDDDLTISVNYSLVDQLGLEGEELREFESGLFKQLAVPEGGRPAPRFVARHRERWSG